LLKSWMVPEMLGEGIISGEKGIVDETTVDRSLEPMHRALWHADYASRIIRSYAPGLAL
jgi:hypothetical protein